MTEHTSDDPQFPCGDYTTEVTDILHRWLGVVELECNNETTPQLFKVLPFIGTLQATYNDCHLREAASALQQSIGCVPHWFSSPGDAKK